LVKTDFAFGKKTAVHSRFYVLFYNFAHRIQQRIMDIKEIINQRYAMPDASLDRLRQCLTEVSYPKGFHVLESGKIEKDIFFIKKGIVRAYTSVDGKEITFWVGKEGATLVSMKGYVNDEPGYETMELMEDSVLYVLERKKLKELFSEDLHIANWGRHTPFGRVSGRLARS
jgi:CRP-like cAMP-binding protein